MDERFVGVITDTRHEPARAPAPDWLFGGSPGPDERPGWFHDPKLRYDLVITDQRLVVLPVTMGAARERESAYRSKVPGGLAAETPGCRPLGQADVAELVVDRVPVAVGEYSSDWALDVVLRSPLGGETRFRAINDVRTPDEVVQLLRAAFGDRVRRAKVVRHGLFRRATRE